ncbi:hypothetical protein PSACC_02694 [Paramicrosporidium saccamoebae]|uniref:Glycosyltransferase family 69 protein n=1 Tax=Paramicrosporidium saccamoebae TaxID=1246581 RepID=A0A2H9TIA6_9FUNG|nr:hypothetical protein PSACC_02694 [Paramicrosporidium saccamoebae]
MKEGLLDSATSTVSWLRWLLRWTTVLLLVYVTIDAVDLNASMRKPLSPEDTKAILSGKRYFIAALLKDNESIMANWTRELLKTINSLGDDNVFVSIVENGDSRDGTRRHLDNLKASLKEQSIRHSIIVEEVVQRNDKDRIELLSELRNKAIEPLYSMTKWDPKMTRVLFLNDIWFKSTDLLELLITNRGEYDIACALDFYVRFYDSWVTRDLTGSEIRPSFPYFNDATAKEQQRHGKPVRVFSCWNGVAVLQAEPFFKKVAFRTSSASQIYHSECFWICYDFWKAGYNRVLINPNVNVAYNQWFYHMHNTIYSKIIHPLQAALSWIVSRYEPNADSLPSNNFPATAEQWQSYR